jgi:hypothetical protein
MYPDSKVSTNKRSPHLAKVSATAHQPQPKKGLLQMKILTAFLTVAITLATVQSTIATTTTPQQPETPQQPQPTPKRGDGRRIYTRLIEAQQTQPKQPQPTPNRGDSRRN